MNAATERAAFEAEYPEAAPHYLRPGEYRGMWGYLFIGWERGRELLRAAALAASPNAEHVKRLVRSYAIHYADYRAEPGFERQDESFARLKEVEDAIDAIAGADLTQGEWIAAEDVYRMARELSVAMNGEEGTAARPSLCDVVAQARQRLAAVPAPSPKASQS